jgi:sulfite reductase alpha subunit-like flavoprotein
MVKGIQDAMINILVTHGNKTKEEATGLVNQWIKEKRYIM